MADLLISRASDGVAELRSVDPFDEFRIYRIERRSWQQTPEKPGVYVLYGTPTDGKLTVYVGMSTTNMRNRIRSHHVNSKKNWFGVLFAVPVPSAILCPAIEAELINMAGEAEVADVIANVNDEKRHLGADDAHVEPAVEKIRDGLELVLGNDIFTAEEEVQPSKLDAPLPRMGLLAREYRHQAAVPHIRDAEDPPTADHAYVGSGIQAFGRFAGPDPEKKFEVLAGSNWRQATLDKKAKMYPNQLKLRDEQHELVDKGILDVDTMTFAKPHVFGNWTSASKVISGKASYAGGYHWRKIADTAPKKKPGTASKKPHAAPRRGKG